MRTLLTALCFCLSAPVYAADPPEAPASEAEAPADEGAAEEAAPAEEGAASKEATPSEEEVPDDITEAAEDVSMLVKAVKDKDWALALGFLLMLFVFVANKFGLKDRVGSSAVPWVATGVAVTAAVGVALATGVALAEAAVQGLLAGVVAIGGWEMLFKHLLQKSKDAVAE